MGSRSVSIGTLALLLIVAGSANAGVSYDLIFRSTGTDSVTYANVTEARAATPVLDLFLVTTDHLIGNGISVGWDESLGLALGQATEWKGLLIPGTATRYQPISPGVNCSPGACSSWEGIVLPPNAPPSLPAGTYHMGTIIWDTSSIGAGISQVFPFIEPGLDGTGAVRPPGSQSNIVDITGSEVLHSGLLNVVPEPSTAALLGLGLGGVTLMRRRRPHP